MPAGCPDPLVCYTEEEHETIETALLYLKKVQRWADDTWIACKPTDGDTQ